MRRGLVPALLIVGLTLAGCTSGTGPDRRAASTGASRAVSTSAPDPSTPAATTSSRPLPRSSASSVESPSTPSSSESSQPAALRTSAPHSTCRSLTVRVIRGSADRGREFAALQFTNTGSARCTLEGYPVVTLRLAGRTIGTPSEPSGTATSRYDLAAGDTAESRLDDYTDCQAPLSDAVHVVVPGTTQDATRPGQLRACTLRVGRLGRPD